MQLLNHWVPIYYKKLWLKISEGSEPKICSVVEINLFQNWTQFLKLRLNLGLSF